MQKSTTSNINHRALGKHKPLPFREVAKAYLEQLSATFSGLPMLQRICESQVANQIETHLLTVIAQHLSPTLYLDFSAYRSVQIAMDHTDIPHNRHHYQGFIHSVLEQGVNQWLQQYPVLQDRLKQICDHEFRNIARLLQRLYRDHKSLCSSFGIRFPFTIKQLDIGLSDRHRGRQIVVGITFQDGTKIIYKPRSIEAEKAWNTFLSWINDHSSPLYFNTVATLSRTTAPHMAIWNTFRLSHVTHRRRWVFIISDWERCVHFLIFLEVQICTAKT